MFADRAWSATVKFFVRPGWRVIPPIAALLATAPALAAYTCVGTVNDVSVSPSSGIVIFTSSAGMGAAYLCYLESTSTNSANGPVSSEQCKAMLTVLLMAQATGQSVELTFNDSLTCTTHPSWAWLTGWYYGPVLHTN